eukprot:TRINITY_DN16507_c0_g1_i2.p1 TRINITY_DN16507_c0_g1~~TRINITY_DN16507_c0_g1_i2.p1  ORF type:complete len:205 (+),score=34.82 TRINITY_DN16507_c0_g1_i2:170-784(+)
MCIRDSHCTFTGFGQLSDPQAESLCEILQEGCRALGSWSCHDSEMPRKPVAKRMDAAAVSFSSEGLDSIAALICEQLPEFADCVNRRRGISEDNVSTKSLSIVQGGCGDGAGIPLEEYFPLLQQFPLLWEIIGSKSPAEQGEAWVQQWRGLSWELQLVSTTDPFDDVAGFQEALRVAKERGEKMAPWESWVVHGRFRIEEACVQ